MMVDVTGPCIMCCLLQRKISDARGFSKVIEIISKSVRTASYLLKLCTKMH